jgi:hypothetical protein
VNRNVGCESRVNSSPQGSTAAHAATTVNKPKMSQLARAGIPTAFVRTTVIGNHQDCRAQRSEKLNNINQKMLQLRRRLQSSSCGLGLSARGTGQPLRCFSLPKFFWSNLALTIGPDQNDLGNVFCRWSFLSASVIP